MIKDKVISLELVIAEEAYVQRTLICAGKENF
jgi:hypothetical protein